MRPAYGSPKLLLEFIFDSSDKEFVIDLFKTIENVHPKVDSVEDLWMNDEILLHVNSDKGSFLFSKDVWDMAFIMADENQQCILSINEILNNSSLFKKEEVDFEEYKK